MYVNFGLKEIVRIKKAEKKERDCNCDNVNMSHSNTLKNFLLLI